MFGSERGEPLVVPFSTNNDVTNTAEAHLNELKRMGTLDTEFTMQYMGWGRVVMSVRQQEILRFLRSVECGGGASRAATLSTLLYAKSLGGRADHLPRTVETCWSELKKVHCNVHFDAHLKVHFNVYL